MQLWGILNRAVELNPDRCAVIDGATQYTYSELARRASTLAGYLRDFGVQQGDRISIIDDNSHMFLETYFAAAALGAIVNPLNTRHHPQEIRAIVADAGSKWLLAAPRFAEQIAEALTNELPLEGVLWLGQEVPGDLGMSSQCYASIIHEARASLSPAAVDDQDVVQLYYTSGTTGRPKGVMLTQQNVVMHALASIAELQLTGRDRWGHFAPMFHLADAWASFAITWVGGCHVMLRRFDAASTLKAIAEHRVTLTNLIPTMLNAIIHDPHVREADCSSLRLVLSGGAPIAPAVVQQAVDTLGCDYVQTYGMTETSPYLTISQLKPQFELLPTEEQLRYRAKTGRPFLAVELQVVNEQGEPVRQDDREVGEIRVRGNTVSPGYWNQPDETAKVIRDGWLYTGDLATIDAERYVTIVDRKKDMIVSGGENVYSTEVENVLFAHDEVREAAVFGVPDATWGEAVTAAVVLQSASAATAEDLIAWCRQSLAGFKVPKSVTFVPDLPRTGSGKISKALLREQYAADRPASDT